MFYLLKFMLIMVCIIWLISKLVFDWFEIITEAQWNSFLDKFGFYKYKKRLVEIKPKLLIIWKNKSYSKVENWVKTNVKDAKNEVDMYKNAREEERKNKSVILQILKKRLDLPSYSIINDESIWSLYKKGNYPVTKEEIDEYKSHGPGFSSGPSRPEPGRSSRPTFDDSDVINRTVKETPGEGDHLQKTIKRISSSMVSTRHRNNIEFVRVGNKIATKTSVHTCEKCGWVGTLFKDRSGQEYFVCPTCERNAKK